ncbi:30S ribosomal protein S1 [Buchnera aphidicola (Pseudoregma panicola)]|uniref:30S ribosomal protein S1 n=1 Tax=Buchnera aphidicola TaxID=9 RepID=UPI0031B6CD9E
MNESFTDLLEKSLKNIQTKPGSVVIATIMDIEKDVVIVDAGLKSESRISIDQFKDYNGKLDIKIGDSIEVVLDTVEDGFGETILSREKAKRKESWKKLEKAHKNVSNVQGTINGKVKGGFTVELKEIRAFLPGSLVDIRPVKETNDLEGKILDFKVIKLDKKRNNVVVSRKAVIEFENAEERNKLLKNLKEGTNVKGIVKNLTDYGAFIDLGGVDGLLHITDMAWKRVKHPNEIVKLGEKIKIRILKFDKNKIRVSLGLKQLSKDPWTDISKKYPIGTKILGKVTNLTDYGCFVEIKEGVEGLVHISEMDWNNKNIHPSKITNLNSNIKVMILDIDEERRRISLGLKQCTKNPWKIFSKKYKKGDFVEGKIKSITDFGIFVGLIGDVDGLIHLSDISWFSSGEESVKKYKKNKKITAVVLQVDVERERISLGIKQLEEDPFEKYVKKHKKKSIIKGTIYKIEKKKIYVNLSKGVKAILKLNLSNNFIDKDSFLKTNFNDKMEFKIDNFDRKNRIVNISFIENFLKKIKKNIFSKKDKIKK